ncbi:hypothetical protein [Pilimelia terevasa]|nr:hypothetical protein [Pilimelia terevasa]
MNSTGPDAAAASHRRRGRRRLFLSGTSLLAIGAAFALFTPAMSPSAAARTAPADPAEPAPEGPSGTHPCTADDALAGGGTTHAGLTLGQVRARLRAGADVRVVGEDGWCTPLTRDYRPQRTNLYLENGLVVRSSMG